MKKRLFAQFGKLEILAFVSGFVLMAYELIAARILAPSIGSSTYVWTSVIGVIIAALSVGYFIGGKLADTRHRERDVAWLHMAAAAAIVWTLVVYGSVLDMIASGGMDIRMQGVVASFVLFVPASLLLGAISPYLVKLKITSLETTGVSAASLSALNSIGGIAGTFTAGFILFGFVGSRESLVLLVALLLAASWLSVPREQLKWRAVVTAGLVLIASLAVSGTTAVKAIDTPSAHYEIVSAQQTTGEAVRLLLTGPGGAQSGIYVERPESLLFWYTQELARVVMEAPKRDTILILGGGAFTLPQYLATRYPDSQIDTVEIDPELEQIAVDNFGYTQPANATVIAGDARSYANQTSKRYDIVIVDVYNDTSVPFSMLTREYSQAIDRLLTKNGIVVVNAIAALGGDCQPLLEAIHGTYSTYFAYTTYTKDPSAPSATARSNMILVYSRGPLDMDFGISLILPEATVYTDNFMPADRLQQQCMESAHYS